MSRSGTGLLGRIFLLAATSAAISTGALAQGHGTAPGYFPGPKSDASDAGKYATSYPDPGYVQFFATRQYPLLYSGEVWTGTAMNVSGREISIGWIDKTGKIESFAGEVVPSYDLPTLVSGGGQNPTWQGIATPVAPPSASLLGQRVMAYYFTRKEKVKLMGKKFNVRINFVFRVVRCSEPLAGCPSDTGSRQPN